MNEAFQKKIEEGILTIGPEMFSYDKESVRPYEKMYQYIASYADRKELYYTKLSLMLVRGFLYPAKNRTVAYRTEGLLPFDYFNHCMSVARMLIDLHIPIAKDEEDVLLAAALCHILIKKIDFPQNARELTDLYHLDPRVYEIIRTDERDKTRTLESPKVFFNRIQKNKLALLMKLADRGNVVEQLYGMTIWEAREYVYETRLYVFPMCIYAKENYPDLYTVISILMEKMRSLIEVTDILAARYQERETALNNEILSLKEENSRIRALIARLKKAEEE